MCKDCSFSDPGRGVRCACKLDRDSNAGFEGGTVVKGWNEEVECVAGTVGGCSTARTGHCVGGVNSRCGHPGFCFGLADFVEL